MKSFLVKSFITVRLNLDGNKNGGGVIYPTLKAARKLIDLEDVSQAPTQVLR